MNQKILSKLCFLIITNINGSKIDKKDMINEALNFYKNKKVLVTGGAGFIGSYLVEKLVSAQAQVKVLDNLSTGKIENLSTVINDIEFIYGDISDLQTCHEATKNIDIIFHLAAYISVPGSIENPQICHNINVNGTHNLLLYAKNNNVKRFVFSSSSAVYGIKSDKCSEESNCNPESPYGLSKLMGEFYCNLYKKIWDLHTANLRYFNVYGVRQNPTGQYAGVIAKFLNCLKNNESINIFGDGLQTRDFIPVQEVIEANIILGSMADKLEYNTLNIATGKSITLLDMLKKLKADFPDYNKEVNFLNARPGDIRHSQADCSRYDVIYSRAF